MAGFTATRGTTYAKTTLRAKSKNMLGQGQFSIYLPRRVDAEYYVRSPVKVKAEMLLSPENLGGRSQGPIPCRARAEKLTRENGMSVVNVPIKIEAELLLTPGMSFSCKPPSPQSPTPLDIHGTSSQRSKPPHMAESWELWGRKMKAALSKYRAQYGVKSENLWQTKHILVSELRLDNNSDKAKELTKQINTYSAQVLEQNKRIRLLQTRLREEEGGRAVSSEKVNVIEQQCRSLEKRLKAAESRAMVAEHQAEAIKLRTRDLGVVCGHQGVQLKELSKQVDLFAKFITAQKIAALDTYKALEHQVGIQTGSQPLPAVDATTNERSGSTLSRTSQCKSAQNHSPFVMANPERRPMACRKTSISSLENQRLSLAYSDSTGSMTLRDQVLTTKSEPRLNSECSLSGQEVSHLGYLLNQLMHLAPNWNLEFSTSLKRAEELVQHCSVQALKLKDLSAELDCVGTKIRRDRKSSVRVLFIEPQAFEIRSDSVDSSPFPERSSSKPALRISVKDVTSGAAVASEQTGSSVHKPVFHRFTVIAKPSLESPTTRDLVDKNTQTVPVSPLPMTTVEIETRKEPTRRCRHLPLSSSYSYPQNLTRQAALRRASWPIRYELQMWRLAGRTMIQASLLWFGIRLLPQMQLFRFVPPPT